MSSKGVSALEALPKGFLVAFPAKQGSHIGSLTLVSLPNIPYLSSLVILS